MLGLGWFLGLALPMIGQTLEVKGIVTDALTGQALTGVSIRVPSFSKGTYTDQFGGFSLTLPTTEQETELIVSLSGYVNDTSRFLPRREGIDLGTIGLTENGFTADDVVITATKGFQQSQSDLTSSIQVVKSRSIDLQAVPSVDKVISQIPGVDNQDGQINIRGSSGYAYGVGSRVVVTLDGLPLLSGDAGTPTLDLIPVDNIAQIEVLKGASSVLYGSSALGGVINIVTADPGPTPKTSVRVRGGLYGLPSNPALDWDGDKSPYGGSIHLFHSRKIGTSSLTLQGNFIKESGYRQETDTEEYRGLAMWRWQPIKDLTVGVNASLAIDSSGQILYWRSYYPDTVDVNGSLEVSGGALTPTLDDGGLRRQYKQEIAIDPVIKYLTPTGQLIWYRGRYLRNKNTNDTDQSSDNSIFYNDLLVQTMLGKHLSWVTGLTYTTSAIDGDSLYGGAFVFEGDTIQSTGRHTGESFGVYSQLDGKFGKLNTNLGFRYESVTIDDSEASSLPVFRAGLNYELVKGTNVRASFGQAFRVPSIAERFANTSGGGILIEPNPNILSERGFSAELGIRQGFLFKGSNANLKGYLDIAAFRMQYENMVEFGIQNIAFVPGQVVPEIRFSSINVANARIDGLELTSLVEANVGSWNFLFNGGVTYIDPRDLNPAAEEQQLDLVNRPADVLNPDKVDRPSFLKYRQRWTTRVSATVGYRPLSVTANFRQKSFTESVDQYLFLVVRDLNDFRMRHPNGQQVLDLIFAYDITPKQQVSLVVDNALNEEYTIIPGFLGPQRKFTVQYLVRF